MTMSTMIGVDMSKKNNRFNHSRKVKPIGHVKELVKEDDGSLTITARITDKEKPSAINVFDGFTSYVNVLNWLAQNKITMLVVKHDITEVEVNGDTITVPPHLEVLVSGMLWEINHRNLERMDNVYE